MATPVSANTGNVINRVKLPIVFVPGVMGSRLELVNYGVKWDPDAKLHMLLKWALFATTEVKRQYMNFRTSPAKVIGADKDFKTHRGKETVYKDYHKFLEWLSERKFGSDEKAVECPVYTVGYDWRQSNWNSGYYLNSKIDEVLEIESVNEVIVITHSMGGLVTRAGLERCPDMAAKIKAVIHVVHPATGGLPLYRRLFTGMQAGLDYPKFSLFSPSQWLDSAAGCIFALILGNFPHAFASIVSATAGPMELLPNNNYRDVDANGKPAPWLYLRDSDDDDRFFNPETDTEWPQPAFELYQFEAGPPGVYSAALHHPSIRDSLRVRVTNAEAFHDRLELKKHENTWSIYGTGVKTDHAAAVTTKLDVIAHQPEQGDGTVPGPSGAALFPGQALEANSSNINNLKNRQFEINDVEHESAFNNKEVRSTVERLVKVIISS